MASACSAVLLSASCITWDTHVLKRINQPSSFSSSFNRERALSSFCHCSLSSALSSSFGVPLLLLEDLGSISDPIRFSIDNTAASRRDTSLSTDVDAAEVFCRFEVA